MDQRRWIKEEQWLYIIMQGPHDRGRSLSDVSIFKIPDFLKDTKREAYVPQGVSLGPYHHGSAKLTAMDHYKGRALRNMMSNYNNMMHLNEDDLTFARNARSAILRREAEIRGRYEERIGCNGDTLSMMLSLDGCFILEVLKTLDVDGLQPVRPNAPILDVDGLQPVRPNAPILDVDGLQPVRPNAPIFGDNMVAASKTLKDILMLENQIPWIVLLELLKAENPADNDVKRSLLKVMLKGTCGLFKISDEDMAALLRLDWLEPAGEVHHLLGFVHKVIVYRPPNQANPVNQGEHRISIDRCIARYLQMLQDKDKALNLERIPSAFELKNVGFKFRPCNGGIAQIKFDPNSSTIYLPLLSITHDTEVLFRNLIAFEMCRPSELYYAISYLNLMDDLIDSQLDVAFLRSKGILANLLGSDQEVADLFDGLFEGVSVSIPNTFNRLRKDVNANYNNRTKVQLIELVRFHFRSPLKATDLMLGIVILYLTIIQTIFTIIK